MAQNLMIDGTVFHGVDSISMTNENGEKVTYIEKTNAGTGVYVAEIGERQFYTVEDALAAAVSGEKDKVCADHYEIDAIKEEDVPLLREARHISLVYEL